MPDSAYGSCAFSIFICMLALWGINLRVKDPTFIDAFWGIGFAMQSLLCIPYAHFSLHSLLLASIVSVWGLRLSRYLFSRWRKFGADKRYAELLDKLGGNPMFTSLYSIFLAQGLAMWIVGLPIQHAASTHARLSFQKLVGAGIAIAGMLTESLADWQMAKFRANPANKDKVMDRGLWSYSRHPNYFGSSVFWWGVYLFCAPSLINWTIIAPIYMTFLLVAVTGVPTAEASRRNDPEYQRYMRRTHMFIPWFHKDASISRQSDTSATKDEQSDTVRASAGSDRDRDRQRVPERDRERDRERERPVDRSSDKQSERSREPAFSSSRRDVKMPEGGMRERDRRQELGADVGL